MEEQTKNNSILDLMRTNYPAMVFRVEILPGIADHDAVFTEVDTRPVISHQNPQKLPLQKKANCDAMQKDIKLIQLEEMDNKGQDVNKM